MRHCQPASAVTFFYFDFNDGEKQRHDDLIRSLIVQLSTQSATTPQALRELYSHHGDGRQAPTTARLVETLKEIIGNFHQNYIVLGALDECARRHEPVVHIRK